MSPIHEFRWRRVQALLDGEASPADRARALRHLRSCRGCRDSAGLLLELRRALGRRHHRRPPDLTAARLRQFALGLRPELR